MSVPPVPAVATGDAEPRSPLAIRDFRVYWLGQLISLIGMWMQQLAFSWVVTKLTGQSADFGLISLISAVPMVALAIPAGALADRVDRRKMLIWTQVLLALVAIGYAALMWTGHMTMPVIYAGAVVMGTIAAFDFPAQQALVPNLVPPRLIGAAIGMNMAIFHGARAIGPALAGVLIALTSPAAAFLANGLSYLAVIYSLLIIKTPTRVGQPGPAAPRGGVSEGLRYCWQTHAVRLLVLVSAVGTIFLMPIFAVLMPVFATQVLHAQESNFGLVMGATGLGAFLGSLTMMRIPVAHRRGAIMVATAIAASATFVLSTLHSPLPAAITALFLNSSAALSFGLISTMVQQQVPDALRGRVMSVFTLTFTGLMPPAAFAWGLLADRWSLPPMIRLMAVCYGVLGVGLMFLTRPGSQAAGAPSSQPT